SLLGVRWPIPRELESYRRIVDASPGRRWEARALIECNLEGCARLVIGHASEVGGVDGMVIEATPQKPTLNPAASEVGGQTPRQWRLEAVLNADPPYLLLDGKRFDCKKEVAIHFVAELIKANGASVAFSRWLKDYPQFLGARSDRDLKHLPSEVKSLMENSR